MRIADKTLFDRQHGDLSKPAFGTMTWIPLVLVLTLFPWSVLPAQQRWHRGNTHTHTNRASPDVVVQWYKENGYDFVVITDLNYRTPVERLDAVVGAPGRFLVLAGVEVSDDFEGRIVDISGIGVRHAVQPQDGATIAERLNRAARAIRNAGGVPIVNHPNLTWALTAADIAAGEEVRHFEVWNAEPGMHNLGGGGSPSTEEIWDEVLSTGRVLYGVAADDAHAFHGEFSPDKANPGRAWIVVRAAELTSEAILTAIDRGDFYASTGVELNRYEVDQHGIRLELPPGRERNPTRYRTYFIGEHGAVLKRDESLTPSYEFQGDELYVRARIQASTGGVAWTQPVFLQQP